ncbi:MAG: hypothetical protein IT479_02530 [Xanthomonadales bacterium]|nr:hypothetical protein [Xanthomonadales bacterium]MCC6592125.1 hypothetical protein [Xanthomonadales bacterium]MCE7931123.1 hypothetical protein [Xanthomonadales bacterium PRO6]
MSVRALDLPERALLQRYRTMPGAYSDCYALDLPRAVALADYVHAFYCTWLFRLERLVLRLAVARPSTDAQAAELGAGTRSDFAAWTVEVRAPQQLLLCDLYGRTRSWLMTEALADGGTRCYFGSAVVPRRDPGAREPRLGGGYSALLGLHRLYSRALLAAAAARLRRTPGDLR